MSFATDSKKVFKDFRLAARNLPLLVWLPFPFSTKKYAEHMHIDKFLTLHDNPPNPVGTENVHEDRWFYANGVVSDRTAWVVQAEMISKIFGKKVEALFNPTQTILVDLVETVYGRTFNRIDKTTKDYLHTLRPVIESGVEVHIVAYSQGGVVISNTIKCLIEEGVDLSNVNVYTFGSAHDEFEFDDKVYSEHFANTRDYVASIGVLHFRAGKAPVFVSDNSGHLLNAHYLYNFINGDYCGGASQLYSLLKT